MARRPFDPDRLRRRDRQKPTARQPELFDSAAPASPTQARSAKPAKSPSTVPLTVTQLIRQIKSAIDVTLPATTYLIAEVADLSRPKSGHLYMTLKDGKCEIRAVMFKSAVKSLKFDLENGLEVLATGSVEVYEPRGQVQFYVRKLVPRGQGALELAFRQMHDRLQAQGLFDAQRKRSLPPYPDRMGVVTSPSGAAIQDIIRTVSRRHPATELVLFPVRVQGADAPGEIARAIAQANRVAASIGGIDVLIVGRGGGSLEDLWAFNEEQVARAIFESRIPVISAVGHEVDVSISDLVADVRAATPTAAAELAVPDDREILEDLAAARQRLRNTLLHTLELSAAHLSRLRQDEFFRKPMNTIQRSAQELDESAHRLRLALATLLSTLRSRLERARKQLAPLHPALLISARHRKIGHMEAALRRTHERCERRARAKLFTISRSLILASPTPFMGRSSERIGQFETRMDQASRRHLRSLADQLDALSSRLEASGHETVLRRGYSLTRDARTGRILRDARTPRDGDLITTQLQKGVLRSRVETDRRTTDGEQ